jgi:hypothetical protein
MRRMIALGTAGVVLLLLVVAQLALPGIAARQLRDRLGHNGRVLSVEVDAFPAVQLLWHQADKVVVRMADYRGSATDLGNRLAQANDVNTLDASVGEVDAGLLTLRNATLKKRGNTLTGSATVTVADLRRSLPGVLQDVQPVSSASGQLTLRGTASLFGISATADATVRPDNGKLVIQPDVPILSLATITVFANPHVYVKGVSATAAGAAAFNVSGTAALR